MPGYAPQGSAADAVERRSSGGDQASEASAKRYIEVERYDKVAEIGEPSAAEVPPTQSSGKPRRAAKPLKKTNDREEGRRWL